MALERQRQAWKREDQTVSARARKKEKKKFKNVHSLEM
jgi:hypothetical protein